MAAASLGVSASSGFDWQPGGSGGITTVIWERHTPTAPARQSRLSRLLTRGLQSSLTGG